ncbi:hypothetical protein [Piscirickettsia litoralis]|uniref:N-acetyltransferase domain-containing protein n=1 Tax=Piscirickettsia litoralis TaxID=1891921 RepID=A0ABX3A2U5_9GAMM|nr:hypothetical protein [Piscirickettsia litoralis]ODN41770.1 hypothetical protein BGC07_00710 [Piscirickettsia litoralis]
MNVCNITETEASGAAEILSVAFEQDPFMLWVFGSQEDYLQKSQKFYKLCIQYCIHYGYALRTENFEAVALRKKPGDISFSFWRMMRSGMMKAPGVLGKPAFDRLMAYDKLSKRVRSKELPDRPYLYCWLLGTHPAHRERGFADALMVRTF